MLTRLLIVASLLAGCNALTATEPAPRPSPPPSLTKSCARPVRLPERDLSGQEGEILWGRDRAALAACGSQLGGLVAWEADMRGGIQRNRAQAN